MNDYAYSTGRNKRCCVALGGVRNRVQYKTGTQREGDLTSPVSESILKARDGEFLLSDTSI